MAGPNWKQAQKAERARVEICEAIEKYISEHSYSPTPADIAKLTSLGESTVRRHIQELLADGRVIQDKGRSRTLRLAD